MKTKIIILGINGFIGNYIWKYLSLLNNYEVVGYSSQDCNLLSSGLIQRKLSDITPDDVIIMTSAITRLKENSFDSMMKNVSMTDNIVKLIGKNRVSCFIFLSTVDVYGLVDSRTIINERLLPNPNDYYALSKLSGEYLLKRVCSSNNIPLLILRLSGIYGSGDHGKSTINKLIESAIIKKEVTIYGDGKDKRDFVYIEDVGEIVKSGIEKRIDITINVATGKSYSITEIVDIIKSCCQHDSDFAVKYKPINNFSERRVKDIFYDISLLTSTFHKKLKDVKVGIPLYLNEYVGKDIHNGEKRQ